MVLEAKDEIWIGKLEVPPGEQAVLRDSSSITGLMMRNATPVGGKRAPLILLESLPAAGAKALSPSSVHQGFEQDMALGNEAIVENDSKNKNYHLMSIRLQVR